MSELKTNKVSPATGTALAVGDSGDTITVPSGATLDISASTLTPPATMPASSGVNFTALNATNLGSGTVPTARLGSGTADATTFLRGDQSYAAPGGGDNTPSFMAKNGSDLSVAHNTFTKMPADTEIWDTDSAYDAATNYRFTVPSGEAGKYAFWYGAYFEGGLATDIATEILLRVNGTTDDKSIMRTSASTGADGRIHGMCTPMLLAVSDYVEMFVRQHGGSTSTCLANFCLFGGYKIII